MSFVSRRFSRHASRRLQRGFINIGVRKLLFFGSRPFSVADLFKNGEPGAHFEAYDPNTLLARRNRLTYSSQFQNAAYSQVAILSVTPNADGVGDLVIPTTALLTHGLQQFVSSVGTNNTVKVRAKPGGYDWIGVRVAGEYTLFNVTTGVVGITGTNMTASIAAAADAPGYYDCTVTHSNPASNTFGIYVFNGNTNTAFAADGVSGIYLARAQVEWNTTTPSVYQDVTDWNTEYLAAAGSAAVGMWQDSAGTTPVTAVEQPVGKWMDWKGTKGAAGNHATQATSGQRPLLSARVNLLTKTEQFDDAAWVISIVGTGVNPSVSPNSVTDPKGGTTADGVTFNIAAGTTAGDSSMLTQTIAVVSGVAYTGGLQVKALAAGDIGKTIAFRHAGAAGYLTITLTNAWQPVTRSENGFGTGNTSFRFGLLGNVTSNGSVGVAVWGADFRTSDDAAKNIPAYQRVNTAGDYDTANFPEFPRLDGIDDNLGSASGGGGTTGFLYCAAVTPTGGAGAARVLWADTGTNTGYRVQINTSNQLQIDAGNATAFTSVATAATLPLNETHVLTAWDDGANLNVQIDNGAVASIARPAVSAGSAGFSVGKSNTAASGYFTGRIYTTTYRQSDCGDARRAKLKRYHGLLVGVAL